MPATTPAAAAAAAMTEATAWQPSQTYCLEFPSHPSESERSSLEKEFMEIQRVIESLEKEVPTAFRPPLIFLKDAMRHCAVKTDEVWKGHWECPPVTPMCGVDLKAHCAFFQHVWEWSMDGTEGHRPGHIFAIGPAQDLLNMGTTSDRGLMWQSQVDANVMNQAIKKDLMEEYCHDGGHIVDVDGKVFASGFFATSIQKSRAHGGSGYRAAAGLSAVPNSVVYKVSADGSVNEFRCGKHFAKHSGPRTKEKSIVDDFFKPSMASSMQRGLESQCGESIVDDLGSVEKVELHEQSIADDLFRHVEAHFMKLQDCMESTEKTRREEACALEASMASSMKCGLESMHEPLVSALRESLCEKSVADDLFKASMERGLESMERGLASINGPLVFTLESAMENSVKKHAFDERRVVDFLGHVKDMAEKQTAHIETMFHLITEKQTEALANTVPTDQYVRYTAEKAKAKREKRERDAKKETTNDQGNAPLDGDQSCPPVGPDSLPVMEVDQKEQIQHVAGDAEACRKIIAKIDLRGRAARQEFEALRVEAMRTLISNMVSFEDEDGADGDREHMVAVELYFQDPASMVQPAAPLPTQQAAPQPKLIWSEEMDETSTDEDMSKTSGSASDASTNSATPDGAPDCRCEACRFETRRCQDCEKIRQTLAH